MASFVPHWVTPYFTAISGFPIRSAHFDERHGLIVLIALGESVVAIGVGVRRLDLGPGITAAGAALYVLGLVWFRWLLRAGPITTRIVLAALCLVSAVVGLKLSPEAQLGVLVAVLCAGVLVESRAAPAIQE